MREELEQAQQRARQAEARKSLLQLTWNLSGANGDRSLEDVRRQAGTVRGALALLLPNVWSRIVAAVVVLALAGLACGARVRVVGAVPAGLLAGIAAWGAWAGAKVRALLGVVDRTAKVAEVQKTSADAELETARATEARLQQELEDLRSGRRLARFAVARGTSSEYRSQLGLISKVHDDFLHMSTILAGAGRGLATRGKDEKADLPPVERIVLYIDDLDRCPPKRVVEVLEAVHLILAVPLFVVVVAVDPRWLVQSLRLHYSELLAVDGREAEDDPHWQPTPQTTWRRSSRCRSRSGPCGRSGVTALVQGCSRSTRTRRAMSSRPRRLRRCDRRERRCARRRRRPHRAAGAHRRRCHPPAQPQPTHARADPRRARRRRARWRSSCARRARSRS